jgi:integrase
MASTRRRTWTTSSGQPRSGWEVSWYENGERRKRLFTGPGAQAKAKALRARKDIAPGAPEPHDGGDGATTVLQAGERWVRYVERELGRERSTWIKYEQHLRDHLTPAVITRSDDQVAVVGTIAVKSLTSPDCEALKDALLNKLSAGMAARVLGTLRMTLNDVVRRGEILANPAQTVRIRQVRRGEDEVEIPTIAEMQAIIAAAAAPPPARVSFAEVWVGVTMFSGLRPSENRGAAIEDLVLDGPKPGIQVRRRADQWSVIGPVKSSSGRRFVSLGPAAVNLLKRWLLVVPRGEGVADPERADRKLHLLFPTGDGTVQSLANLYHRMWVPLMTAAGLFEWLRVADEANKPQLGGDGKPLLRPRPVYSMNCLRHFAASLMIDQGMSPKKIQKRMGHSSIQVTYDRYGHLFDKKDADADEVAMIERQVLGPAKKLRKPRLPADA